MAVPESSGDALRGVYVFVTARVLPSTTDWWKLFVGLTTTGPFEPVAEFTLQNVVEPSGARFPAPKGARLPPGNLIALKLVQRGSPAPLDGLSVALDYGILGAPQR